MDSFVYAATQQKTNFQFGTFESKRSRFGLEYFANTERTGAEATPNLHALECPLCTTGLLNRTRYSIAPFGAKATYSFWHDHFQLFTSLGGVEAWKQDGLMQGMGRGSALFRSSQFNDQWLVQSHVGARFFIDRQKNVSFGFSKGYMYNFGLVGPPSWTSSTVDLTITFGNGPATFAAKTAKRIFGRRRKR